MDLSKCFDSMPHASLMSKLDAYGLSTEAYRLLSDYLCNRKQRTKIGISRSTWFDITKCVPQGTGLGPFLLNVFINDLFLFMIACKLYNYADDNTITKMDTNVNVVLNSLETDACNAITWFQSNFMKANPDKFQVILLCPRRYIDIFHHVFSF
jgi:hypothetical protein